MPKAVYDITLSPSASDYREEELDQVFRSNTKVFLVPYPVSFRNMVEEIEEDRDPFKFEKCTFSYWHTPYSRSHPERVEWFTGTSIPLSRARQGATVLVQIPRNGRHPQCGGKPLGVVHVVKGIQRDDRQRLEVSYLCGEASKHRAIEGEDVVLYSNFVPTCMDCRAVRWRTFQVLTEVNPKLEAKMMAKAKANSKRREDRLNRKPTRFDRIIEEVTVRARVPFIPLEPEMEDPVDRGAKIEARVRVGRLEKEKRESFKKERR